MNAEQLIDSYLGEDKPPNPSIVALAKKHGGFRLKRKQEGPRTAIYVFRDENSGELFARDVSKQQGYDSTPPEEKRDPSVQKGFDWIVWVSWK